MTPEEQAEWLRNVDTFMETMQEHCVEHPDGFFAGILPEVEESISQMKEEMFEV